ncbi:MAG: hypothetical protein JXB38_17645 [Anaerolineales bacterium]|nr:hypothetical protein [Anaerolineales bacterium]
MKIAVQAPDDVDITELAAFTHRVWKPEFGRSGLASGKSKQAYRSRPMTNRPYF